MNHTRFIGWLVCFMLALNSACTAVSPAQAPAVAQSAKQLFPLVTDGVVFALSTPATYASLNAVLKDATSTIWQCPNCTHMLIIGQVPGWTNAVSITLVNTLETSPDYWDKLTGVIASPKDGKMMEEFAHNVIGYNATTPKDLTVTTLAMRVANFLAGVGAGAGEVMLAGMAITLDDYMQQVNDELGMEDY